MAQRDGRFKPPDLYRTAAAETAFLLRGHPGVDSNEFELAGNSFQGDLTALRTMAGAWRAKMISGMVHEDFASLACATCPSRSRPRGYYPSST